MAYPPVVTLAFGSEVFIVLVVLMAVGRAIYGALKKTETPGPARRPPMGGDSAGETGGGAPSAEELAARRRRELQMLARQRQGGTSARPTAGQPANLSMEQLRQRARAKEEYERRVAALRQQQTGQVGAARPPATVAPPPVSAAPTVDVAEAEARRRRAELARQQTHQEAQRRAVQQERLRQQEAERRRLAAPRASSAAARSAAVAAPGQGVTEVVLLSDRDLDAGESGVDRHILDATLGGTGAVVHGTATVGGRALAVNAKTMRDAVALSEILARPVSLRRTDEGE